MATLAKSGSPSTCTLLPAPDQQHTLPAFVDVAVGDMVYIKSDGTFDLTADTAPKALYFGMTTRAAKAGSPVTARHGHQVRYGTGMTPGARYYPGAGGILVDTAGTNNTVPCAIAVDDQNLFIIAPTR